MLIRFCADINDDYIEDVFEYPDSIPEAIIQKELEEWVRDNTSIKCWTEPVNDVTAGD